jgi:hypothetical protein
LPGRLWCTALAPAACTNTTTVAQCTEWADPGRSCSCGRCRANFTVVNGNCGEFHLSNVMCQHRYPQMQVLLDKSSSRPPYFAICTLVREYCNARTKFTVLPAAATCPAGFGARLWLQLHAPTRRQWPSAPCGWTQAGAAAAGAAGPTSQWSTDSVVSSTCRM